MAIQDVANHDGKMWGSTGVRSSIDGECRGEVVAFDDASHVHRSLSCHVREMHQPASCLHFDSLHRNWGWGVVGK